MSGSERASVTRPFYAAHGEAYDLPITDPVEPWVEAVDARLHERAPPAAGARTPPHVVQAIARDADLDVTLAIYAHTNLDAMRDALDKID
jgi:hypothetical protein